MNKKSTTQVRLTPDECLERFPFLVSEFNWTTRGITQYYNGGFLNGIYSSSHKGILINLDSLLKCISILLLDKRASREKIEKYLNEEGLQLMDPGKI